MIEAIPLPPESTRLQSELASGLHLPDGLVFALDCGGKAPAEPWGTWVAGPTEQVLVRVCGDLQAGRRLPSIVGVVRTTEPDSLPRNVADATRAAAVAAMRGTLDAVAAELAPDSVRSNVIVVDNQTTLADAQRSLEDLLDDRAAGFTTGTTLWLGGGSVLP